jgi:hypothetical protein
MNGANILSSVNSQNPKIDNDINSNTQALDRNITNSQMDDERAITQRLLAKYQENENIERDAPQNTQDSKYNYYRYLYKDSDSQLVLLYSTEAYPMRRALIQEKNNIMTQINQGIYYLNSQSSFLDALQTGTVTQPESEETITPKEKDTTLRKASFYASSTITVRVWTNIMNCIIFVYGFILLYAFRSNLLDPLVLMSITLTFASVFVLESILKFIFYIPQQIFKFIGWGYAPIQFETWWYLWIPASLIAIYILFSAVL